MSKYYNYCRPIWFLILNTIPEHHRIGVQRQRQRQRRERPCDPLSPSVTARTVLRLHSHSLASIRRWQSKSCVVSTPSYLCSASPPSPSHWLPSFLCSPILVAPILHGGTTSTPSGTLLFFPPFTILFSYYELDIVTWWFIWNNNELKLFPKDRWNLEIQL